ncbi:MAG: prepilin-type N-terminal cleavage/methylation domain-containing protein [Phycisphaeraceae bacterium]|nr:prepilin-type N-terminal cleavage/methylation domain-containing protein [Phycisphaeraceae bacterium]MCW5753182.1 prepilin-type N-terminal cleavage/methylation domain-containing protein [Phycisphaeraceae bacterium]
MSRNRECIRAFTLVEILIVVVILGILAAIIVPQFTGATQEARQTTTIHELEKLRRAMGVYQARHDNALPPVEAGDGTWGPLVFQRGEYLAAPPINPWVGGANRRVVILSDQPDSEYQTDYAWIFNPDTGDVWAGSFDENDDPILPP